jgi:DNA-binding MarR family transcriptional regulator
MKQFPNESDEALTAPSAGLAALLMDTIPLVMRYIRMEMRSHREPGLSIPQFRTLVFLDRNQGASLSEVASHIGLTLPSASKIINALVARKLVIRSDLLKDRRYNSLKLTKLGHTTLMQAQRGTAASLAEKLAALSPGQKAMVEETMKALGSIFVKIERTAADKGR